MGVHLLCSSMTGVMAKGPPMALGLLTLPLHEFRVDGAQTPLTGHLPPPPHRVGAPKATGGVLQIGEPSMDGVRHEGPPAPPAEHGGRGLAVYRESAVSAENVACMGGLGTSPWGLTNSIIPPFFGTI